jgi:hypothetical protein
MAGFLVVLRSTPYKYSVYNQLGDQTTISNNCKAQWQLQQLFDT